MTLKRNPIVNLSLSLNLSLSFNLGLSLSFNLGVSPTISLIFTLALWLCRVGL